MVGDDRVRFCADCSLHVYNISALDRLAAERLISEHEGHLCLRMYKRSDGTLITADCRSRVSAAFKKTRASMHVLAGMLVGVLAAVVGCESGGGNRSTRGTEDRGAGGQIGNSTGVPDHGNVSGGELEPIVQMGFLPARKLVVPMRREPAVTTRPVSPRE